MDGFWRSFWNIRVIPRVDCPATKARFAEGENVCQIYDLVLAQPPVTLPIAQWLTVREGKIAALRVYFDPRPLFEQGRG